MTLTEFLLARIAEDEAVATAMLTKGQMIVADQFRIGMEGLPPNLTPERLLAGCEAKRRTMARHTPTEFADAPGEYACVVTPTHGFWPCPDLLDLAAVYATHPDYDEAWRP